MSGASIVAFGAVSALGEGRDAFGVGAPGAPARVAIAHDEELAAAGLARPFVARAHVDVGESDRATALLLRAAKDCTMNLDAVRPPWRRERLGLAIGTSSGGMRSAERFFRGEDALAGRATYFAPMHALAHALARDLAPTTLVLGACAASTIAIGLALRWLDDDACDLVIAGGFDAVSVFVASGFEVLRATSAQIPPRPFRVGRDGMALGEGAALVALAPKAAKALAYVAGFGASADAVHLTAPNRTGGGLARAMHAALADANVAPAEIDLISAHATATPFNDPAETRAIATVLGAADRAVVHPFKAQIGHTLGAAGALEALACVDALERGVLPAAAGTGPMDPDASVRLLDIAESGAPRAALKLSAAFGGANAALVLTHDPPRAPSHPRREAYVGPAVAVKGEPVLAELASSLGWATDRLARCDGIARFTLAAVAALAARCGSLRGAGILVGQSFATLETNRLFFEGIQERGGRFSEPRRFPYTSPNAAAGEASVAFGLTGPCFGVGAGLHAGVEALAIASQLVRAGDADRVVVVAVDEVGDAVRRALRQPVFAGIHAVSGAVAVLVTADPHGSRARISGTELAMGPGVPRAPTHVGHLALLPLTEAAPLEVLQSSAPLLEAEVGGASARVLLAPL